MHRFRSAAFLNFIFSDITDLRRLLIGMGGIVGASVCLRDTMTAIRDVSSPYSSGIAVMSFVITPFVAAAGASAGLVLTFVLHRAYDLWVSLYYRVRPRVKVWFKASLIHWSGLNQALTQSLTPVIQMARQMACTLVLGLFYCLALCFVLTITGAIFFALVTAILRL